MEIPQDHRKGTIGSGKVRNTNLEVFRIITMLLIIAHHYVVNSGLTAADGPILADPMSAKSLFLFLFGAWGKIGINCFVLITGYFMCVSSMTVKRFVKLVLEVVFYNVVISAIFWISGYQRFSLRGVFELLPVKSIGDGFTSAYIVFMLCIPFINALIRNINQKQHVYLLLLVSFLYIFLGTVRVGFSVRMNYVSWFIVLYLFSSFVRLYPRRIFESAKFWGGMSLVCVLLSAASVLFGAWIYKTMNLKKYYFFVTDSNALLAFLTGFSSFMFFKNAKIAYSRFVNGVASTCFGVLMIHANSDAMRKWLWKDVLNNIGAYAEPWLYAHAVFSVIGVFAVCAGLDYLRIVMLERPFFRLWDKCWPDMKSAFLKAEKVVFSKIGIRE